MCERYLNDSDGKGLRYFKALVTRDTTESAYIPIMADDASSAIEIATSRDMENKFADRFVANEGNVGESTYFGDPDDDVIEITKEEYEAMQHTPAIRDDIKLYLEAYAVSNFGNGPRYARYDLTEESLTNILKLQKVCTENGLNECRVSDSPDWDGEDDLCLTSQELVVTPNDFWFIARPDRAEYHVETRGMTILMLVEASQGNGDIYFGEDIDNLRELVAECKDGSEGSTPERSSC